MDKNGTTKTTTTRVFKSGNSQAVRIPADMAFDSNDMEVTVTRSGDEITIRPKRASVSEMIAALRALPPESKFEPIERTQTRETEWDR
jgi:antitoxin VapB